jgi:hypothetical protein
MLRASTWMTAVTAILLAACGGSSNSQSGGVSGTPITCAWFSDASTCYRAVVAAAQGCTNGTIGTFDADTRLCTFSDGTTIHFDGEASASTAFTSFGPWDFDVLTSTAMSCASYRETSDSSYTFTAAGVGTFTADWSNDPLVYTCPDGTRYVMAVDVARGCSVDDFPNWWASRYSDGRIEFELATAPTKTQLWQCR